MRDRGGSDGGGGWCSGPPLHVQLLLPPAAAAFADVHPFPVCAECVRCVRYDRLRAHTTAVGKRRTKRTGNDNNAIIVVVK